MFTKHENPEAGEEQCEGVQGTQLESPFEAGGGLIKPSLKEHASDGIYVHS